MNNYTIIVPSSREVLKKETIDHFNKIGQSVVVKNGKNYPSFSKLINDCVIESPTETLIISNDRSRPTIKDIEKTIDLLEQGYGFVGLYAWGFFGLKKELFRRVGFMDERFVGGNYEDCDYMRRMLEADIAMYNTFEIQYREDINSSWDRSKTKIHFDKKWSESNGTIKRLLDEEQYNYNLGKINDKITFLSWKNSILGNSQYFIKTKLII